MIAQNFEYESPTNLKDALALLSTGDTKVLAGGMSLIPMMKLRLARPETLIEITAVKPSRRSSPESPVFMSLSSLYSVA